ncbi:hypothetical protein [Stenotrophomonas oahuensis]|uniref:Ig-like domain-containing protein n=1 Tax=Stenotrophomonas oahuensis TaxID=3003271 RepID=A0ABY9YLW6_9GAMM|nr:hypothetical protein [Stenotrophomonas sp. A5586]WNH51887.1 hypothetical protein PDM29_16300 [Stenotrophomonas sp. A5586]
MTSKTPSSKHNEDFIGMAFVPIALYAPQVHHTLQIAIMHTLLPSLDPTAFDYTVNGVPGPEEGIELIIVEGSGFGQVQVHTYFARQYNGPWPVLLEIRYLKEGVPVDRAFLQLRESSDMKPRHMHVQPSTTSVKIPPPGEESMVYFSITLFDEDHVPLPFDDNYWDLELAETVQGVYVKQNQLRVAPGAQPGRLTARVTAKGGLAQTFKIDVVAP